MNAGMHLAGGKWSVRIDDGLWMPVLGFIFGGGTIVAMCVDIEGKIQPIGVLVEVQDVQVTPEGIELQRDDGDD